MALTALPGEGTADAALGLPVPDDGFARPDGRTIDSCLPANALRRPEYELAMRHGSDTATKVLTTARALSLVGHNLLADAAANPTLTRLRPTRTRLRPTGARPRPTRTRLRLVDPLRR